VSRNINVKCVLTIHLTLCHFTAHFVVHAYVICRRMNVGFGECVSFLCLLTCFCLNEIALDVMASDISFWVVSVFHSCLFLVNL
jgi:hypothetical protein